jgi:hypothetical protein
VVSHVVAVVENKYLVDAAVDQADRPAWGIVFPSVLVAPCDKRVLTGQPMMLGMPNGAWGKYQLVPGARTYTHSRDWWLPERTQPLVEKIVRLVKERI